MEVLNITSVVCLRQTCIVTGHSASHVKVVTSLCKWSSMHKYGINENGQTLMQLYTIDMSNHHPMDLFQGHGDRHPQPHPDSLHARVLAHPEPPGPLNRDRGTLPVLTKQQTIIKRYWHMWEYTSDHAQVTADEDEQNVQTFVHLLGTRSNVPIILQLHSVHGCVSEL